MNLYHMLHARGEAGQPVRVGLVGAGKFGSMFLAQARLMPGLHLVGDKDLIAPRAGHGEAIAEAWGGPVTLRSLPKATHLGITEGRHWSQLLLDGKPERSTQRAARALLTAFFLVHLAGRGEYRPLLEESVRRCPIEMSREPVPASTKKR